jgi:hypothetical protein
VYFLKERRSGNEPAAGVEDLELEAAVPSRG